MRTLNQFLSPSLLLLLTAGTLQATSDWPSFRGPDQTGGVAAQGIFEGEVTGLALDWKTPIGPGYSGIVVHGDRAFTQTAGPESDLLIALDLTQGETLWQAELGARTEGHDGSEDGPSPTPATDGERIYAASAQGKIYAFDAATGKTVWTRDLVADLKMEVPLYEYATSPVLIPGLVILTTPAAPSGSLVALDRATGETRWAGIEGLLDYQTPIAGRLAGRDQLLIWQQERLVGVSYDGEELWTIKADGNNETSPVILPNDQVLLYSGRGSTLLQVRAEGDGYGVDTLWQSNQLKGGNSSLPVYFDGHIYGYDRAFLSCIDVATGKRQWKSRPPGGSGLIRVEDRLVAFGKNGDLVVIKATPEAYTEETRIRATDRESLTWPAFADGRIFVRDATHIAAVRITDQPTPPSNVLEIPPALIPGTTFTAFVEGARDSNTPSLWVDEFMKNQERFPVLETDGEATVVHFIYRGAASDVSLTFAGDRATELPLEQLQGTDFFYRSVRYEPLLRTEYNYRFDLDRTQRDPRNSRAVGGFSEVVPADWQDPPFLAPYRGSSAGRLDTFELESTNTGDTREITLYRPPEGTEPQVLWIVLNGTAWLSAGTLPNSLDHEVGRSIAPVAVAFVPAASRMSFLENDGRNTPALSSMVTEELVPHLAQNFGLDLPRKSRIVMSADRATMSALYTGLMHPDSFGTVTLLEFTGSFGLEQELQALQTTEAADNAPRVVSLWNPVAFHRRDRGYHSAEVARELAERLPALGYDMVAREREDSYGWGSLRTMAIEAMRLVSPAN